MSIIICQVILDDVIVIYDMIYEFVVYEKVFEEVVMMLEEIREMLFVSGSKIEVLICEVVGKVVGYVVFFISYFIWFGCNGIYMEDLYVIFDYCGIGVGKVLLKIIV